MHADVARQALQGARQVDQGADLFFFLVALLERWLVLEGTIERPRVSRVVRDELGESIAQHVGQVQDATGVPDHRFGA